MKHTGWGPGGDLIQLAFRTTKHTQKQPLGPRFKGLCAKHLQRDILWNRDHLKLRERKIREEVEEEEGRKDEEDEAKHTNLST